MIKVLRHGNRILVKNPVNPTKQTEMIDVIFVEEGRSSGDASMSGTSSFLSRMVGDEVGLQNLRIHTHPVRADKIGLFPLEKELPGHINRGMYSTPQMRQQENAPSRIIDGRPTFFKTWLAEVAEEDKDLRISTEALIQADVKVFRNTRIGGAEVTVLERAQGIAVLTGGNEEVQD